MEKHILSRDVTIDAVIDRQFAGRSFTVRGIMNKICLIKAISWREAYEWMEVRDFPPGLEMHELK